MSRRINLAAVEAAPLQADFDRLSAITEPDKPWTRRSFTPMFLKGRDYLKARFEEEGLSVRLDAAGNLIGRLEGTEPGVILTGSHSDTVPSGGRFDGIAGIVCGLAALRALKASGYTPRHTIELVDFLAEEPSEWGLSCVGSRGMAGALGPNELALLGPDQERLYAAIDRIGGDAAALGKPLRDEISAFVEIHIEQGPVLEAEGVPIGIVTGIAGIGRLKVRFEGIAAHAGTAPMHLRQDAGLSAARFMLAVRDGARKLANAGRGHFTATTGAVHVEPNGANVVPGAAEVIVDIRAENDDAMDAFIVSAEDMVREAADAESCTASVTRLSRTFAVPCDQQLQATIAEAADHLGLKTRALASGAGHDTAFVARLAPAAMIFVPSREGRSHCPEEWTEISDFVSAANLLAETLMRLDQS